MRRGNLFLASTFKVALGEVHQTVDINGNTTFAVPGVTTASPGGLLALPTNIGSYTRDHFAVVPEVGVKVGYQVTEHLRVFVGYTFLYLSNVLRPGELIDRTVNVSQLPSILGPGTLVGAPRPALTFKDTDFWTQGVNFGLELRY